MLLLIGLSSEIAGSNSAPPPTLFNVFLSFVTNCPPLENAVVEMQLGGEYPKRFEFVYQSNAFLGKELCTNRHTIGDFCLNDTMCGCWENEYWYYNPAGLEPLLYDDRNLAGDTKSAGYAQCEKFKQFLGLFQSFGASSQGVNSLWWSAPYLRFVDRRLGFTNSIALNLSNGVPTRASIRMPVGPKESHDWSAEFTFDTNVAPAGIPVEVRNPNGPSVRVLALKQGDAKRPLPKSVFFPSALFENPKLARVVRSNDANYYVGPSGTYNMSKLPEISGTVVKVRRFYLAVVFGFSFLVLFILLLVNRRHKNKPKQERECIT